jgi:hypothetical protein
MIESRSYLQCRRHVPGFVGPVMDPEWVQSDRRWHKLTDERIQIFESRVESTLKSNIDLQNFDNVPLNLLVKDSDLPEMKTNSWKEASPHHHQENGPFCLLVYFLFTCSSHFFSQFFLFSHLKNHTFLIIHFFVFFLLGNVGWSLFSLLDNCIVNFFHLLSRCCCCSSFWKSEIMRKL